jgi:predicted O-methyltransferase YrrM
VINVDKYKEEYQSFMRRLRSLGQPESTGGMTGWPGQFIWSAVRTLKPLDGLEIGTRNGMSAAICTGAMEMNGRGSLTTLDVVDVLNYEARPAAPDCVFTMNPREIQKSLGISMSRCSFWKARSTEYMEQALMVGKIYDYILIDGSHKEEEVYDEIELAAHLLSRNGIVILDDVYPDDKPRGTHKKTIKGPWRALERAVQDEIIRKYEIPNPRTTVAYFTAGDLVGC